MGEQSSEMDIEWIEDTPNSARRRVSHIRSCCAEGCKSKGYRLLVDGERVQYFPFPMYDFDLCNRWASAVNLEPLTPYEKAFVCSKHFRLSDYKARVHDESKRTLRRTAIPSCEPVAGLSSGQKQARKKVAATYESSDESYDEDSADMMEISTLVNKKSTDGEGLTVLMVKDANNEQKSETDVDMGLLPPIIKHKKKLPLICDELLALGPPYPWTKQGLENWVTERMAYHEEHLQKTRDCITDETVAAANAQEDCQEREELMALIIIKKGFGRLTLKSYLRAILE